MNYTKESFEQGQVLLLQKPFQWTSFDVIGRTRKITGVRKVGHAGTLDPLATGLLIVCTGKFTKRINEFMGQEKEYTGSFTLGATTPTYDLESEPENFKPADTISTEQIIAATTPFTGVIQQIPPAHSAIKQGGKRVYELARQGKEVKMESRTVTVKEFEITAIELPIVHFRVVCSTGTYIRSLAFDFGNELGCGAYLSKLCRTRIGDSLLENAMTMEEFAARVNYKWQPPTV